MGKKRIREGELGMAAVGVFILLNSGLERLHCEFESWAQTCNSMNVKSIPSKWNRAKALRQGIWGQPGGQGGWVLIKEGWKNSRKEVRKVKGEPDCVGPAR